MVIALVMKTKMMRSILKTSGKTFLVGCYYRVPDSRVGDWKDLEESLDKIPRETTSIPHINVHTRPRTPSYLLTLSFAACMIGDAVTRYFCRSPDASTLPSILLFSTGCTILIVSMVYIQYFGGNTWTQNHIFFGMVGNMLWMMGSVIYYYQSRYSGGHAQLESRLNMHLRFDGFLVLVIGLTIFGFPDLFLKIQTTLESYDGAHLHMARSTGALLIGSSILSFMAPGFLFDWDKRAIFVGRIVKLFLTVLAVLYAAAKYDAWGGNLHLYFLMESIVALNALLGYYAPHETERYKSN
eukprot:XP_011679225.1 PREDICTED: uncharacterized protein LOC588758 [Strongylocentrotus purpuratus]